MSAVKEVGDSFRKFSRPGVILKLPCRISGNSPGSPMKTSKPDVSDIRVPKLISSECWSIMMLSPFPFPTRALRTSPLPSPPISFTRSVNAVLRRMDSALKAQQTPESVVTGLKMSEQLTEAPAQEQRVRRLELEVEDGEQGRLECHSSRNR